jgi:hypothetical protein
MYLIDRTAVIIKAKKPFLEWINCTDGPKSTLEAINEENNIYLVGEYDTSEELEEIMQELYGEIFAMELHSFCTDQSEWPKIDYKLFQAWFEIKAHSMVFDLYDDKIEKEVF